MERPRVCIQARREKEAANEQQVVSLSAGLLLAWLFRSGLKDYFWHTATFVVNHARSAKAFRHRGCLSQAQVSARSKCVRHGGKVVEGGNGSEATHIDHSLLVQGWGLRQGRSCAGHQAAWGASQRWPPRRRAAAADHLSSPFISSPIDRVAIIFLQKSDHLFI